MFTVSKTDIPTHWWAYAGNIEERTGECPDTDSYFRRKNDAIEHAANLKMLRLNRDYIELKNRASKTVLAILRIRSLWNSRLRENLNAYLEQLRAAELALAIVPTVNITYLPDEIPVLGNRIPLGTRVYEFDTYSLKLHVATVESESISYYSFHPEGVAAYYRLSNGRSVKSDLQSGFSNIEHYLDGNQANRRMREAVQTRIEELQELLR